MVLGLSWRSMALSRFELEHVGLDAELLVTPQPGVFVIVEQPRRT
jgi:hypothetical protein